MRIPSPSPSKGGGEPDGMSAKSLISSSKNAFTLSETHDLATF